MISTLLIASLGGVLVGSMLTAGVYTHEMSNYSSYYDKVETCLDSIYREDESLFLDVIMETDYYQEYIDARDIVEQNNKLTFN